MIIDISVIVPTYNSINTIERAFVSTRNQGVNIEVIVVDDHSDDGTADFVDQMFEEFDGHFQLIRSRSNLGAASARNKGINQAQGKYIAFLDSDDLWLPNKLSKQLALIESSSEVALVSCDSYQVSPCGNILGRNHEMRKPFGGKNAWKELLERNFIPTPTVMTRTDLLIKAGGFNEQMIVGEDLDLWISLCKMGELAIVPEVLVHYFDYGDSLMMRQEADTAELVLKMLQNHINDGRLTNQEKNNILANRYFQFGVQQHYYSNLATRDRYFSLARKYGYSSTAIKRFIFTDTVKGFLPW